MMAGADRHAFLVQDGADVVWMHPLDRERDDAGRILGAVEPHRIDLRQSLARLRDQGGFMRVDAIEPDAFDIVDRGMKPERANDMRRPGFES